VNRPLQVWHRIHEQDPRYAIGLSLIRFSWFIVVTFFVYFDFPAKAGELLHKVRIYDTAMAAKLEAAGARLVADYGGYRLYDTTNPPAGIQSHPLNEFKDEYNFIELSTGRLDTRLPKSIPSGTTPSGNSSRQLQLLQFAGPILPEWKTLVTGFGIKIVSYIPENTYLIYGTTGQLANLAQSLRFTNIFQWQSALLTDFKIHPSALGTDPQGKPRVVGTDLFTIQLVEDQKQNTQTLHQISLLLTNGIVATNHGLGFLNLVVRSPGLLLTNIANCPDVVSVQPLFPPHPSCERQDQIAAGNLNGYAPSGQGYLAWLASIGFTQAQFTASGLVVDMVDSGIDNGTIFPGHFGLYTAGDITQRGRVAYTRLVGCPSSATSTLQGCDGHGNLNAHIVAGYDDFSNWPFVDSSGFHYGLGVCPFVSVGSSVIFDPYYTYPDFTEIQSRAYQSGARISNNSWNFSASGGRYDSTAQIYDSLVRDAQPNNSVYPTAGNQQMVIVVSAGNGGPLAKSIDTPASAKNVIAVGAAESVQAFGAPDQSGIADSDASSANSVWSGTSRGPCWDGRCKPDLCAPGTHVSGGAYDANTDFSAYPTGIAAPCFSGWDISGGPNGPFWPDGQQFYTASSGTSQAAPCVSGGCALIMQYFYNQFCIWPSPAMVKAWLLNSTRYLTGTNANDTLPSPSQGMGEINLGTCFDGTPRVVRDQLASDIFRTSGDSRTFTGIIANTNKPFRVTLAWTDAPGSTVGYAYNNNLDLVVTVGTNVYKGNVFKGAFSVTGGSSDLKNNVENVFLPAGVGTNFTVKVNGTSINSLGIPNTGDTVNQDFALVIYNGINSKVSILSGPTNSVTPAGSNTLFTVSAVGAGPLMYQWQENSNNIPLATNQILVITNTLASMSGNHYTVLVSNPVSAAMSSPAVLTVVMKPAVGITPNVCQGLLGTNITITANATGGMLNYCWWNNGNPILSCASNCLTISNLCAADAGLYTVTVSNTAGTASASMKLETTLPALSLKYSNKTPALSLQTAVGFHYQLQFISNLASTNWVNAGAVVSGNGGTMNFSDPAPSQTGRFYRILAY